MWPNRGGEGDEVKGERPRLLEQQIAEAILVDPELLDGHPDSEETTGVAYGAAERIVTALVALDAVDVVGEFVPRSSVEGGDTALRYARDGARLRTIETPPQRGNARGPDTEVQAPCQ